MGASERWRHRASLAPPRDRGHPRRRHGVARRRGEAGRSEGRRRLAVALYCGRGGVAREG